MNHLLRARRRKHLTCRSCFDSCSHSVKWMWSSHFIDECRNQSLESLGDLTQSHSVDYPHPPSSWAPDLRPSDAIRWGWVSCLACWLVYNAQKYSVMWRSVFWIRQTLDEFPHFPRTNFTPTKYSVISSSQSSHEKVVSLCMYVPGTWWPITTWCFSFPFKLMAYSPVTSKDDLQRKVWGQNLRGDSLLAGPQMV